MTKTSRANTAATARPLLGAHTSTAGGLDKAIDRALSIDACAMQIFVKNNMQWFARPFTAAELKAFHDHPRRGELRSVFGHGGYLINLAAVNASFLANSRRALTEELIRADQLALPFLVLHPGAHMGAGEEAGLEAVVASLDGVLASLPEVKTKVALEVTAGQGSSLGHRFEHLAHILSNVREPERLCVCLDTAHLFAAGYDISTESGIAQTLRQFATVIGSKRLAAFHLNDSKTILGSHVDRHEAIGRGKIGLEAFRYILREPRFQSIPKVLETPKSQDLHEDVENLRVLNSLIAPAKKPRGGSGRKSPR